MACDALVDQVRDQLHDRTRIAASDHMDAMLCEGRQAPRIAVSTNSSTAGMNVLTSKPSPLWSKARMRSLG